MDGLEILPVRGIGDVANGDDLAELISQAAPWITDGDVLVVTSKIVSKAEGRVVEVPPDGPEREEARDHFLAMETRRIVARRGRTAIVQTHHGFVMAAAGIDASNVDKTHLALLPTDPDASARRLRTAFAARGVTVAVIISDTMGRAWRNGQTDVALGAAGLAPIRDHRGDIDPYGNELEVTEISVADELASAGELVKGKLDQVPVAVVRGYPGVTATDGPGAAVMIRDPAKDMFSKGTDEARAEGLRAAVSIGNTATDRPAPVDAVHHAIIVSGLGQYVQMSSPQTLRCTAPDTSARGMIRFGADVYRLRVALAAEGLDSSIAYDDAGATIAVSQDSAAAKVAATALEGATTVLPTVRPRSSDIQAPGSGTVSYF
jgi:coenzyme F420-0:L-glutamate ligase / coenzyme F420-1:gamma-L-glutamate ligase